MDLEYILLVANKSQQLGVEGWKGLELHQLRPTHRRFHRWSLGQQLEFLRSLGNYGCRQLCI